MEKTHRYRENVLFGQATDFYRFSLWLASAVDRARARAWQPSDRCTLAKTLLWPKFAASGGLA
jgi:hypothetical protein